MSSHLLALTSTASALHRPSTAHWTAPLAAPAPAVSLPEPSPDVLVGGQAGATSPLIIPNSRAVKGTSAKELREDTVVEGVRLSEVVGALSFALDITEGQPMGHAVRTTLIGMRLADHLGVSDSQRSALFYTLLLKDLGCSSNAARLSSLFGADDRLVKHAYKLTDWTSATDTAKYVFKHSVPGHSKVAKAWRTLMIGLRKEESEAEIIQTRCERGADIARMLHLPNGVAEGIRALDEHWDGEGKPFGLSGSGIPMLSRIAGLAQTVEVFASAFDVRTAYEMAHARRGRWFDPVLVDCLDAFQMDAEFWGSLRHADTLAALHAKEPEDQIIRLDDARLDSVAEAFARVIDAKSPFTATHSQNVATIAVTTGAAMGLEGNELRTLKRAALLHDIGKLGVSNIILDKPSSLDAVEYETMRQHTRFTLEILKRVSRFRQFAATAAAHHERLDGSGYHLGLKGDEIGKLARIIAVADVTEALSANRPYRGGMPAAQVTGILDSLVAKQHLDGSATEALKGWFTGLPGALPQETIQAA